MLNCTRVDHSTVHCDGKDYHLEELLEATDGLFWVYLIVYLTLVLFAGINCEYLGLWWACPQRTGPSPYRSDVRADHGAVVPGHSQSRGA